MSAPANDTYFFLLDHPAQRGFDLLSRNIPHRTPRFSREVYEASRGQRFASEDEAYVDWVEHGRMAGLEYAPGVDTVLKIVLKVKDEPVLLERWITYHAAAVGLSNLVIMDCGSQDPAHLAILERYKHDLLVLGYPHYYDQMHGVGRNRPLYYWLSRNARYVTVMDADEFLLGLDGDSISPHHAVSLLRHADEPAFAPTWLTNHSPPADAGGQILWSEPITFLSGADSLRYGTVQGKSVARSTMLFDIGYVGHNLHLPKVSAKFTERSFGRLFQFHLSHLGETIQRERLAKHIRARGVLPAEVVEEGAIAAFLRGRLSGEPLDLIAAYYVDKYLNAPPPSDPTAAHFATRLLSGLERESAPALREAVDGFDFRALLAEALIKKP